jgi:hypothetical protein
MAGSTVSLTYRGKQEIATMSLGDLPDLEETQSGKDLIAIGKKRGMAESILLLWAHQHGFVPDTIRQGIQPLELQPLEELLPFICRRMSLEQPDAWLAARAAS